MSRFAVKERGFEDDAVNGSSAFVVWEGPAADLETFKATELTGTWTTYRETFSEGDQLCRVELRAAATTNRDGSPKEDGLIIRKWGMQRIVETAPIGAHPTILGDKETIGLVDLDPDLPAFIELGAEMFREWQRTFIKTMAEEEDDPERLVSTDFFPAMPAYNAASGISEEAYAFLIGQVAPGYFRKLIINPNATYTFDYPTLRKTEIVTSASVVRASHANKGRIFSTGRLIQDEPSLPSAILLDPDALTPWYWLKESPSVGDGQNGFFQIEHSYVGVKKWDVWMFGNELT